MALVATPIATVVSCGGTKDVSSPMKYLEMDGKSKEMFTMELKHLNKEAEALKRIHQYSDSFVKEYVFANKTELTDKDVKAIKDAKDSTTAYNELQKLLDKGIYKLTKHSNSVITLNKKEIDLGEFVSQEDFNKWAKDPKVSKPGKAATSISAPAAPTPKSSGSKNQTAKAAATQEEPTILEFKGKTLDLGKFVAENKLVDEVKMLLKFKVGNKEDRMVRYAKGLIIKRIKDVPTRADAIIGFIKASVKADDKGTDFTDADFKAIKDGKDEVAQDKAIDEFIKKNLFSPEFTAFNG